MRTPQHALNVFRNDAQRVFSVVIEVRCRQKCPLLSLPEAGVTKILTPPCYSSRSAYSLQCMPYKLKKRIPQIRLEMPVDAGMGHVLS